MKKVLLLFLIVLGALFLTACQKEESLYTDGVYTAFVEGTPKVDQTRGDLTWVTVTIEDGEIVSYYIDVLQYKNGAYLELSKKELGDAYGMATEEGQLEWYEQAKALESFFLSNSVDAVELDETFHTDLITGVTITVNVYVEVANLALEAAKTGVQPELPTEITSRLD